MNKNKPGEKYSNKGIPILYDTTQGIRSESSQKRTRLQYIV